MSDGSTASIAALSQPSNSIFAEVTMPIVSWAVATTATLKGVALGLALGAGAVARHRRKHQGGRR